MTDREIFKAELDRLKEETYIGLSEHENGVKQGRMEVINSLYKTLHHMQEEPVSEDLENEIEKMWAQESKYRDTDYTIAELTKQDYEDCARHFANWQKQQDNIPQELVDAFGEFQKVGGGAVRDFINAVNGYNSNKSISEDLEKAAIYAADEDMQGRQIMEASNDERQRYSRIFRRGFKAGANWQKQQMMAKAIDAKVVANGMGNPILHLWDKGRHLIGKKVKLIIIKEGQL